MWTLCLRFSHPTLFNRRMSRSSVWGWEGPNDTFPRKLYFQETSTHYSTSYQAFSSKPFDWFGVSPHSAFTLMMNSEWISFSPFTFSPHFHAIKQRLISFNATEEDSISLMCRRIVSDCLGIYDCYQLIEWLHTSERNVSSSCIRTGSEWWN